MSQYQTPWMKKQEQEANDAALAAYEARHTLTMDGVAAGAIAAAGQASKDAAAAVETANEAITEAGEASALAMSANTSAATALTRAVSLGADVRDLATKFANLPIPVIPPQVYAERIVAIKDERGRITGATYHLTDGTSYTVMLEEV